MIMHALSSNFSRRRPEPIIARRIRSLPAENRTTTERIAALPEATVNTRSMRKIHEQGVKAAVLAVWTNSHAIPSEYFSAAFNMRSISKIPLSRLRNLLRIGSYYGNREQSEETPLMEESAPAKANHGEILELVTQQHREESSLLRSQSDVQEHEIHLLSWLSNINHQEMHNFNTYKRYRETGVCLSRSPEFQSWRDASRSCLFWLNGAGKMFFHHF